MVCDALSVLACVFPASRHSPPSEIGLIVVLLEGV